MATHMEPIELPVLFIPENAMELHNLGIETDEVKEKYVCFFRIDMIAPSEYKGRQCSEVFVGGEVFTCTIPYERLKTIIKFR